MFIPFLISSYLLSEESDIRTVDITSFKEIFIAINTWEGAISSELHADPVDIASFLSIKAIKSSEESIPLNLILSIPGILLPEETL